MIAQYLINQINQNDGKVVISDMVEKLGYSHRYTDYVFKNVTGIFVKKYASIVRLQKSLTYILEHKENQVYEELGYLFRTPLVENDIRISV